MRVVVDKVNRLFNGRVWVVRLLMAIFVMSTAVVLNGTVNAQDTFACSAGRYSCNAPESVARSRCALNEGAQGAMWFNTSDNAANESGYYSATVNVSPTSNSVRVNLRGSVNSCADASRYTAYAVNISPSGSNAARLTGLAGSVLNRGTMPGSRTTWSSQGSSLGADLNVSGLAMNNAGRTDSQTIVIGIYRCFSTNGSSPTGTCFATDVEVTVVREAGPNFNLNPTLGGSPRIVEAGSDVDNQITLTPAINNTGSTNSSVANWQLTSSTNGGPAQPIASGDQGFAPNVTNLSVGQQTIGDVPVGTRICYTLSVSPISQSDGGRRSSTPFCVIVGKKPKVQVLGNDLIVGRGFSNGIASTSSVTGAITTIKKPAGVAPPYDSSMISGLWQTGVNNSGQKLSPGAVDPHWQLANVYPASANGTSLQPASGDAHWNSSNGAATCQPGPYPRSSTVVDTSKVFVGINNAWNATLPSSAWVGGYEDAGTIGKDGSCSFPAQGSTIDQATFEKAPIWVFKLTNGFTIDQCVNPGTIRLNMKLSADDEVQVLVNGVTIAEPGDFSHYGQWPSTPVSYTTGTSPAFRTGSNSLEIRVKSAYQYTGLLLDSISVAQAACDPIVPGNVYGSWAEYGIFAPGIVTDFGSGSALSDKAPSLLVSAANACSYSPMTFTNVGASQSACGSSSIGGYVNNARIPDVASYYPTTTATPIMPSNGLSNQGISGVYRATTDLTLNGGALQKGRWLVINAPNSTVTINGNITYNGDGLGSISEIPQLIIIAKNINIAGSVDRVDAWLIANGVAATDGAINTCSDVALTAQLTTNVCNKVLTVNGPVMAKQLHLRRTAGADSAAQTGQPAEIFNLRPDAYLWGISQGSKSGRLETVYERELPPRF